MRRTVLPLALAAAALAAAPAAAAPGPGAWKGRIDHQGYEITFKVSGGKMRNVVARLLQDCDRDGSPETMTLAPTGAFPIRGGRVRVETEDRYDQAVAHYVLDLRIGKSAARGFIREYDTVEGSGVVCDTLNRTFTARRGG
jgi:hypothetical protein